MLSVLSLSLSLSLTHTHTHRTQGTFGGDGCVYYLSCGDGVTGGCLCPNSSDCPREMCRFFFFYITCTSMKLLKIDDTFIPFYLKHALL